MEIVSVILLLGTFAAIILFEVPGLMRQKAWRELGVFSCLLLVAFIVSLLQVLGVKMPNINQGITSLVKAIFPIP